MTDKRSFGRYVVEISNAEKVFFPDAGITKRDVVNYYEAVAETLLRHVRGRPVSMHRFPNGISEAGFYQKQISDFFPTWIDRLTVPKEDGTVDHVVLTNRAGVVYLAQLGTITPHVWLSRSDRIREPDQVIFDLDPHEEGDFDQVRTAAVSLRGLLEELGMPAFVMLTGSKGIHVRVPIRRGPGFDETRSWAGKVADELVSRHQDTLTREIRIEKREGRIFVDVLRNGYAQTAVPPYAIRARPGAPVAMPIGWDELEGKITSARAFDIHSAQERLISTGDVWAGVQRHARKLPR